MISRATRFLAVALLVAACQERRHPAAGLTRIVPRGLDQPALEALIDRDTTTSAKIDGPLQFQIN